MFYDQSFLSRTGLTKQGPRNPLVTKIPSNIVQAEMIALNAQLRYVEDGAGHK